MRIGDLEAELMLGDKDTLILLYMIYDLELLGRNKLDTLMIILLHLARRWDTSSTASEPIQASSSFSTLNLTLSYTETLSQVFWRHCFVFHYHRRSELRFQAHWHRLES